ncbi:MAG: hypothetical protein EZS28_042889 [Streblomastix strix]|uniref:SPRY domain-containing protein n=1 Tax=Streblomastix strix TaxID=222440 RepID=A0A5J4TTG4_9EUKA|nr:MAG: hypothetical protein EZS28_042889 [Streblomastix strix]
MLDKTSTGIADSSVTFQPNRHPQLDGNDKKTVCQWNHGGFSHTCYGPDNQQFRCGQRIGMEIDISSSPRKLTLFVDDVQQKNYVINVPQAIRFWACICQKKSSFIVTKFEIRSSSYACVIGGQRALEWGKEWDNE